MYQKLLNNMKALERQNYLLGSCNKYDTYIENLLFKEMTCLTGVIPLYSI